MASSSVSSVEGLEQKIVSTSNAPKAIGPYSQAIIHERTVYVSGCIGLIPETMAFPSDTDVVAQTEQVLQNMKAIVEASGSSLSRVLKTTILLKDINDFAKVNEVYGRYFPSNPPARATFAVRDLPRGALVEIECIAYLPAASL